MEVNSQFIALLQPTTSLLPGELFGVWVLPHGITRHVTLVPACSDATISRLLADIRQPCWTVQTKSHIFIIQKRSEEESLSETDTMAFSKLEQGWIPQMVQVRGRLSQKELAQIHIERGGFQAVFQDDGTMKMVFNDPERNTLTLLESKHCSREVLEKNIQLIAAALEKMETHRSPIVSFLFSPEGKIMQLTCSKQEEGAILFQKWRSR